MNISWKWSISPVAIPEGCRGKFLLCHHTCLWPFPRIWLREQCHWACGRRSMQQWQSWARVRDPYRSSHSWPVKRQLGDLRNRRNIRKTFAITIPFCTPIRRYPFGWRKIRNGRRIQHPIRWSVWTWNVHRLQQNRFSLQGEKNIIQIKLYRCICSCWGLPNCGRKKHCEPNLIGTCWFSESHVGTQQLHRKFRRPIWRT